MKYILVLVTGIFGSLTSVIYAQKNQTRCLKFMVAYDQVPILKLGQYFLEKDQDSILIETTKFYISDLTFKNNSKTIYKEKVRFHLVNLQDSNSSFIHLTKPVTATYDELQFSVGIDSATNSLGALGGALDPLNGLYWTWQSGYIHFKLEGKRKRGADKAQSFHYHIGGYSYPYNTCRSISLKTQNQDTLHFSIEIKKIIQNEEQNIMSPGPAALKLANQIPGIFSLRKHDP